MRLPLAALACLLASPSFAGASAGIHVGLVVTGNPVAAVAGTWTARSSGASEPSRLEISGRDLSYQFVSPGDQQGASGCIILVTGDVALIEQATPNMAKYFAQHDHLRPDYVVRYSIRSTEILDASANRGNCPDATTLAGTEHSLFLTRGAGGNLIDSLDGTEYSRPSR